MSSMKSAAVSNLCVGIVLAMEQEFTATHELLIPGATIKTKQYSQIAVGPPADVRYVIVQAGVGTTNAAIGTCDLLADYEPDFVLNLGTAALINDPAGRLQIGDVLIGKEHYQWDLDMGGPVTNVWTDRRSYVDVLKTNSLTPDADLLRTALELDGQADRRMQPAEFFTGNSFFMSDAQHSLLPANSGVQAVDMESFAVAQVCARKSIPFLCLRGITDTGREGANEDFYANVQAASAAAASFTKHLLKSLVMKGEA